MICVSVTRGVDLAKVSMPSVRSGGIDGADPAVAPTKEPRVVPPRPHVEPEREPNTVPRREPVPEPHTDPYERPDTTCPVRR